jgi:hypothetical protein
MIPTYFWIPLFYCDVNLIYTERDSNKKEKERER